jgi:multidrug efflux pump
VPLSAMATVSERPAGGQPHRPVPGGHRLLQPGPGASLGEAVEAIKAAEPRSACRSIVTNFQGAALAFQASLSNTCADPGGHGDHVHRAGRALRELHPPITILSTLPSAGGRAAGAAGLGADLGIIGIIGIIC